MLNTSFYCAVGDAIELKKNRLLVKIFIFLSFNDLLNYANALFGRVVSLWTRRM